MNVKPFYNLQEKCQPKKEEKEDSYKTSNAKVPFKGQTTIQAKKCHANEIFDEFKVEEGEQEQR